MFCGEKPCRVQGENQMGLQVGCLEGRNQVLLCQLIFPTCSQHESDSPSHPSSPHFHSFSLLIFPSDSPLQCTSHHKHNTASAASRPVCSNLSLGLTVQTDPDRSRALVNLARHPPRYVSVQNSLLHAHTGRSIYLTPVDDARQEIHKAAKGFFGHFHTSGCCVVICDVQGCNEWNNA